MSASKLFQRVPFTKDIKNKFSAVNQLTAFQNIEQALSGTSLPLEDVPHVMVRINTESLAPNIDTFVITTSAHPNEIMKYTADTDTVTMNDEIDGGFF
jgi:hypothetical protein